jgi:hypothetical protein
MDKKVDLKYCCCCKSNITRNNFTTHKKTKKHIKNKEIYEKNNTLYLPDDDKHKILKIQLHEIKNIIDNLINGIK